MYNLEEVEITNKVISFPQKHNTFQIFPSFSTGTTASPSSLIFVNSSLSHHLSELNCFPGLKEKGKALVRVVGSTPGETNRIPFIVYVAAITFATHSIHMTNSYFIPDDQIVKALTDAAGRGVDVKIILPGITDSQLALSAQRHHYSGLLQAGVKLYEHKSSLLHAKTAVIDQVWSTVGSTNMDFLSLLNNDEVNAVILDHEFADEMEKMFVNDLADSSRIEWEEWRNRPLFSRLREWFVNIFVRWL